MPKLKTWQRKKIERFLVICETFPKETIGLATASATIGKRAVPTIDDPPLQESQSPKYVRAKLIRRAALVLTKAGIRRRIIAEALDVNPGYISSIVDQDKKRQHYSASRTRYEQRFGEILLPTKKEVKVYLEKVQKEIALASK